MYKTLTAIAAAVAIAVTAVAMPTKAEAHNDWWIPGAIIGGLAIAGAVSGAYGPYYYYGPGPYYAYGPGPYYGRGYYYPRYRYRHGYYRHRYYRHYRHY